MATQNITKPKSIRNLELLSPQGSVVAVWADKKKDNTYFVAVTTKAAGWTNFKQRKDLDGPFSLEGMLKNLEKIGKRAQVTLEHVTAELAQRQTQEDEAMVEDITADPMFEVFLQRAQSRTTQRNAALVAEVETEIEALRAKLDQINEDQAVFLQSTQEITTQEIEATNEEIEAARAKILFNLRRKSVMVTACTMLADAS